MAGINENYLKLQGSYLFAEVKKRRIRYMEQNPDARLISLGIGDVTRPLPAASIAAMHLALDEMADEKTFKGYAPDGYGYSFLINKIIEFDYNARGVSLDEDEVFISDGAKSDTANFQEIFETGCRVAMTDPVYPVYIDSNVMAGRTGSYNDGGYSGVTYLPCTAENGFTPELPEGKVDLIYLCFPNNPTGMTLSKKELEKWVDYARKNKAVILFDSAYKAYISEPDVVHSIYEIEGAKECAVEFRSYSKTAGFTGVRCSYAVVPKGVMGLTAAGKSVSLNDLWFRRQTTKYNGTSYIIHCGAAAIYTDEGRRQVREMVGYYMENASIILQGLKDIGIKTFGGVNAPYIWLKTPNDIDSWTFFDKLLNEANIVGTPGSGFGPSGRGYFRLTAFGKKENTIEAVKRLKNLSLKP